MAKKTELTPRNFESMFNQVVAMRESIDRLTEAVSVHNSIIRDLGCDGAKVAFERASALLSDGAS